MLEIEDLWVSVGSRTVLKGVNLSIPEDEVHVLFGPNGSGKSTLIYTILGFKGYKVTKGRITFKGVDITHMPINERVKLGLGVAFQKPPVMKGVKLIDVLNAVGKTFNRKIDVERILRDVELDSGFLRRDLNRGFSGGESKKAEVVQLLAMDPDFLILDEPDSGVDVENVERLGRIIDRQLRGKAGLIITHQGFILKYIDVDLAHVMINGEIVCSGDPDRTLSQILSMGYGWCEKCKGLRRKL